MNLQQTDGQQQTSRCYHLKGPELASLKENERVTSEVPRVWAFFSLCRQ